MDQPLKCHLAAEKFVGLKRELSISMIRGLSSSVDLRMASHSASDLGKAEHFGQRASAFLRPVIGSCSTNRNQQYWNLIGEKAEFTRDGHRVEADHFCSSEIVWFGSKTFVVRRCSITSCNA